MHENKERLQKSAKSALEAKSHLGIITDQLVKFISYLGYLRNQVNEIKVSSGTIDHSVDHLASIIEENTATIEELEAMVDESANRIMNLAMAIEQTNQAAAMLEEA